MNHLFQSHQAGQLNLRHRIVMAPMTRIRATDCELAVTNLTIQHYSQRATKGGLIITKAIHISPEATPTWNIYPAVKKFGGHVPGLWTEKQASSWCKVTKAVHEKGGLISCQLLHAGRVAQPEIASHPLLQNDDKIWPLPPVSSSVLRIPGKKEVGNNYNWDQPSTTPRQLETGEIGRLLEDYQNAARRALKADFDCIELHAAHGFLVDQFLCDGVNQRSDKYGGSIENRCRLLFEIVDALVKVVGPGRVGVRLSPTSAKRGSQTYFGVHDTNPEVLYENAVRGLNSYPLAYLLLTEPRCGSLALPATEDCGFNKPVSNSRFREIFKGTLIGAGGFTLETARLSVQNGTYDLIAFGRWFISNPDLVARLASGSDLNIYERKTFYGGNAEGYVDYTLI